MEPTTGKAKYYTLMEALKEQILSGTIKPGQKLPSENELTREYALSRHTVRKALALLENEGYITARHGKGTFCSERVIQRHNSKNIAVTTTYLSDYIFPRLIQGMDRVLSENGYSIKEHLQQPLQRRKSLKRTPRQAHRRPHHRAEQKPDPLPPHQLVRNAGQVPDPVCLHPGLLPPDGRQALHSDG